mmetsp:Transcript_104975/g.185899  ORF Transcript_104975/g.185899 Transcript_104975/m.185899 type:complete len:307 (+) Transcript_104975:146-1066(+)
MKLGFSMSVPADGMMLWSRHVPAILHTAMDLGPDPEREVWTPLLMASVAGASTMLGALVVFFMPEEGPSPKAMALSLSLAAGVMISISIEMLLPTGRHGESPLLPCLILGASAVCCCLLCKLGDFLAMKQGAFEAGDADTPRHHWRLSLLLFASLTAHNLPEGFAVAVTAASGLRLGFALCMAVALHNIPEGITLAVATYNASKSRFKATMMTFYSGLAEPIGALCALLLLQAYLTPIIVHHLLTAVAGIMLYIAAAELMPEAASTKCWFTIVLGFVLGVIVMVLTHWVIDSAIESGHLHMHQTAI